MIVAAPPAQAHDELLRTTPANGSTVRATPRAVVLTFAEPPLLLGLAVAVTGPDGPAGSGASTLAGSTVTQRLDANAPAGRYRVTWRVTADDGHPVTGRFAFTSTVAGAGDPTPTATGPSASATATSTAGAAPGSTKPPKQKSSPLLGAGIIALAAVAGVYGSRLLRNRRRDGSEDAAP